MTSPSRVTRRRFLGISAAALGCAALGVGIPATAHAAAPTWRWQGVALGADAEIRLRHPDGAAARRLFARMEAEIARHEAIFSLYRTDSALSRLNQDGVLDNPPFELVELLSLCRQLHGATRAAFDPSIQPLWQAYAEGYSASPAGPAAIAVEEARQRTGFDALRLDASSIRFDRPRMALTLNGIAQGYITDKIAALLREEGLVDILVDLGEIRASGTSGTMPEPGWPVLLRAGDDETMPERVRLLDRAVASSARLGTSFDAAGHIGHVLDPRSGLPAETDIQAASVIAPSAALADGLSTAALVLGTDKFASVLKGFPDTTARLVLQPGRAHWLRHSPSGQDGFRT